MAKLKLDEALSSLKSKFSNHDQVKKLNERYMLLMASCIADPDVKEFFEEDPRVLLTKFVGMKIPEEAMVILDPFESRWPVAMFEQQKSSNGKVEQEEYEETPLSLTKRVYAKDGIINKTVERRADNTGEINVDLPLTKSEYNSIVVKLPYFTMDTDLLTKYTFSGDSEADIILTSC